MKEITWICGGKNGVMSMDDFSKELRFFEEFAKNAMKETNVDHIIYASEVYNDNDELELVHFYNPLIKLSDEEFEEGYEERTKNLKNYIVYAIHNRKN